MLYGNVSAGTLDEARAANARPDVSIDGMSLSYSPGAAAVVAPGSLVTAYGNVSLTLFGSQQQYAALTGEIMGPWELAGVNVTVGGVAAPIIYTSPGRVAFSLPAELPLGVVEVVITCQEGYVAQGVVTVARNVSRIMSSVEDGSGAVMAVNAETKLGGPFEVNTEGNFGNDKRTRVTFFATGISGSVANSDASNDVWVNGSKRVNFAESVIVEARTVSGQTVRLPVEYAGAQGILPGLDQVTVVLTPELKGAGTVKLTLILNGEISNSPAISIR
jgi:uncharacterized protein (TIGR03437 family)